MGNQKAASCWHSKTTAHTQRHTHVPAMWQAARALTLGACAGAAHAHAGHAAHASLLLLLLAQQGGERLWGEPACQVVGGGGAQGGHGRGEGAGGRAAAQHLGGGQRVVGVVHLGGWHKAVALHVDRLGLAVAGHAGLGGGQRDLAQHGKALEGAAHNVVHHGHRQLQALGGARDGDAGGVGGLVNLQGGGRAARGGGQGEGEGVWWGLCGGQCGELEHNSA
jgi:hypothetical protein